MEMLAIGFVIGVALMLLWRRRYRIARLFKRRRPSTGPTTTTASLDQMLRAQFVRPTLEAWLADSPRARQQRAKEIVDLGKEES